MKKYLLVFFILLFVLPSASALNITNTYPDDGESLMFMDGTVDFTYHVYGYSELSGRSWYITNYYGKEINYSLINFPDTEKCLIGRPFETTRAVKVTGNGLYKISVDLNDVPYNMMYENHALIYAVWDSNSTIDNTLFDYDNTTFWVGESSAQGEGVWVSLKNADPPNGEIHGGRACGRGVEIQATGYTEVGSVNLLGVLTSADTIPKNVKKMDTLNINHLHRYISISGFEELFFGASGDVRYYAGTSWHDMVIGEDAYWETRKPYYAYFGVYDSYANKYFTYDDTVSANGSASMDFSLNQMSGSYGDVKIQDNDDYSNDYHGLFLFFETYGGSGDSVFTIGSRETPSIGLIIRNYGESMGLPWFHLIIAFIIIIICLCIPLYINLAYNVNLPNIIYTLCITAGVSASYFIGLFDFWMFGLFIIILVMSMLLKFKESIATVTSASQKIGVKLPTGLAKQASKEGLAYGLRTTKKIKDVGIRAPFKLYARGKKSYEKGVLRRESKTFQRLMTRKPQPQASYYYKSSGGRWVPDSSKKGGYRWEAKS